MTDIIHGFLKNIMINLAKLKSPILLHGDDNTAYRDPAILYNDGIFYLFYSLIEIESDRKIYSYTAVSTSHDLENWTATRKITPKDQNLNYSSPGNIIRFGEEWILCLQTYPRLGYTLDQVPRYGNEKSRVFIMRSKNLANWSQPELLRVKGLEVSEADMGRMIDPYLMEDKDTPGLWWCFYKQNGVSMSCTRDFLTWEYRGHTPSGENVCVLVENGEYILFHSPENGIGVKKSTDMINWRDCGELIVLGQKDWPWAQGRLTAGAVINMKACPEIGKYLMFFHGSGPLPESHIFDSNASIAIAWSDDLSNWDWPGKTTSEVKAKP